MILSACASAANAAETPNNQSDNGPSMVQWSQVDVMWSGKVFGPAQHELYFASPPTGQLFRLVLTDTKKKEKKSLIHNITF